MIHLYCSYAQEDEAMCVQLDRHISVLKRQGVLDSWSARCISAGVEWEQQVDRNLETANIILLMISADFLNSNYCYDREMNRALERHRAGHAIVIPVILRPSYWNDAPFAKLQPLPRRGRPIKTWPNREEAWLDVVQGIVHAAKTLNGPNGRPSAPPEPPTP